MSGCGVEGCLVLHVDNKPHKEYEMQLFPDVSEICDVCNTLEFTMEFKKEPVYSCKCGRKNSTEIMINIEAYDQAIKERDDAIEKYNGYKAHSEKAFAKLLRKREMWISENVRLEESRAELKEERDDLKSAQVTHHCANCEESAIDLHNKSFYLESYKDLVNKQTVHLEKARKDALKYKRLYDDQLKVTDMQSTIIRLHNNDT